MTEPMESDRTKNIDALALDIAKQVGHALVKIGDLNFHLSEMEQHDPADREAMTAWDAELLRAQSENTTNHCKHLMMRQNNLLNARGISMALDFLTSPGFSNRFDPEAKAILVEAETFLTTLIYNIVKENEIE